ncbi:MAG: FAD-binding oxidoreductase [Candidatus Acidiferrales bacterium]
MSAPATVHHSRIADIVGARNVITDPEDLAAYSVDALAPQIAARPATAPQVSALVEFAVAENLAVIPTAARTKLSIGLPPARYDLAIDMARLDRVISYDPGDLTLSVEPGIRLARLAKVLAEHNQFLPLAVPFFERATVGGTLASGVDSPLRQAYGTARDFVLGVEFVSGDGALAKSGGRVVKNVSGYDLHKLFLGSIGSLGVITRVNFKTFPLPSCERLFVASLASSDDALALRQKIVASPISPPTLEILSPEIASLLFPSNAKLPSLDATRSSPSDWLLLAGISGSSAVLDRCSSDLRQMADQCDAKKSEMLSGSEREAIVSSLREAVPLIVESSPSAIVLKITALPSDVPDVLQFIASESERYSVRPFALIRGVGVLYLFVLPDSPEAQKERAVVRQDILQAGERHNFRASVVACPSEWKRELGVWGPLRDDFLLMQKVKRAFDPHNIFAPGRFVGGL